MAKVSTERRRWRWLVRVSLVVVLVVIIVGFRLVEELGQDRRPEDRFTVVIVKDGDTVELTGGDRLRLLAVDTPEKGEPLYDEATRFLSELVLGKQVRLEFAGRRRDKYGRLLAYVYVDSILVNRAIIRQGYGYLYLFKDTDLGQSQTDQMHQAMREAIQAGVGLWSIDRVPEEYYRAVSGSLRFHRPGCRNLARSKPDRIRRFEVREDAFWEGLSPCRRCKP